MIRFKTENTIIYLLIIYLLGFICRFIPGIPMFISASSMFYCFAVIVWMIAIRERFITRDIRNLFYTIAVLILFLHLSQICKYNIFPNAFIQRHLWYAYYIPFTLIPLFSLTVALRIGKSTGERLHWTVYAAGAFSILLILLIMSNDLHQAVFRFKDGDLDNYNNYSRGIIYYLDLAWGYILLAGSFAASLHKSYKRIRKRYILLTLAVIMTHLLLQGLLYTNITDNLKIFGTVPFTVPMLYNMSFVFFWELGIRYGIIPSNTDYEEIFNIAGIAAQLTDTDRETVIRSAEAKDIPEQIKKSVNEVYSIDDGNRKIHLRGITGGYIYWEEDLTVINALNRELIDTTERLKEENTLLFEETRIKEENASISAVSRIYDDITERLKDKLRSIDDILKNSNAGNDKEFCHDLIRACITGAYVKRYSNITLLSKTQGDNSYGSIASKELFLALRESLEYLSLCEGIMCEAFFSLRDEKSVTSADMALKVYESLEECLETLAFTGCTAMFDMKKCDKEGIRITAEVNITDNSNRQRLIDSLGSIAEKHRIQFEENTDNAVYITIEMEASNG